jgi:PAS domain S-box-containing protein
MVKAKNAGSELSLSTLDDLLEGCQIIGFDWRYIYLNNAADSHNRRPKEELLGQRYMDMWPGIEQTNVFGVIRDCLEKRVPTRFENEFTYPDGDVRWFDLSIQPVPQGVFIHSIDITKRKKAEKLLIKQTERLGNLHLFDQALLSTTLPVDLIISTVIGHTRMLVGSQFGGVVIFNSEKMLMDVLAIHPRDTDLFLRRGKSFDVTGDMVNMLYENTPIVVNDTAEMKKPLAVFHAFMTEEARSALIIPLLSKDDLIGAMYMVWTEPGKVTPEGTEITEEVARQVTIAIEQDRLRRETIRHAEELEKRVELRTEELLLTNKELEAFTYTVSHDLKAPLRGIHGFTEILMQEYAEELSTEGKRLCSVILENSQRMSSLIDDLLAFSRIGRIEMKQSFINMKDIINIVFSELTDETERERIELTLGSIRNITGDPSLIRQVWTNLLSNAIKFTKRKEKVLLSISSVNEDGMCIYRIEDNGAGFDMLHKDKLFGVFERLHNSREFEGTGVGLAIVKRIIHRHGGDIWAEGEVDRGAVFYFSLPVVTDTLEKMKPSKTFKP